MISKTCLVDPFLRTSPLSSEFEGLLSSFLDSPRGASGRSAGGKSSRAAFERGESMIPMNIQEDESNFIVEALIPYFSMEEIEIQVHGQELLIRATPKAERTGKYLRREYEFGSAARELKLPYAVDVSRVEALLKNGILTVRLPKAESAKARKIQVQQG